MIPPDVFLTLLGVFGILFCWEKAQHAKQIVKIDQRRMELYRLRDRLHELVLNGAISDNDKAYRRTVKFLHKIIQLHKEADFLFFCELLMAIFKDAERDVKQENWLKNKEVFFIVMDTTVLLLDAIRSNSIIVKIIVKCFPKRLKDDKDPFVDKYKPVKTYKNLKDFKDLAPQT
jgi:hypothetical protein